MRCDRKELRKNEKRGRKHEQQKMQIGTDSKVLLEFLNEQIKKRKRTFIELEPLNYEIKPQNS